jgi:hypothetical protein
VNFFCRPENSLKNCPQETVDDIDKDGDGKISLDEYIGDMYHSTGDLDSEPDWVKAERESFATFRDENKVRVRWHKRSRRCEIQSGVDFSCIFSGFFPLEIQRKIPHSVFSIRVLS